MLLAVVVVVVVVVGGGVILPGQRPVLGEPQDQKHQTCPILR